MNFVLDGTSLPFPKTDLGVLSGIDPTKAIDADDWNSACQAADDIRDVMAVTVDTVANLKSTIPPQNVTNLFVRGYASPGDGGGGHFVWVAGSTQADDGGTVFASTASGAPTGRWWRLRAGEKVDVRWFGAVKGDGVTDESVAIQKAADAANSAGLVANLAATRSTKLYFPKGRWLVGLASSAATWGDAYGGVKITGSVEVCGDGDASWIEKSSGSTQNYVFRVQNAARVKFRDVAIDVKADANYQVAIYALNATSLSVRDCRLTNSLIPGGANWTVHGVLAGAHDVDICDCTFVRTQIKVGTPGVKTLIARNRSINPYNQAISWVFAGNELDASLTCLANYIEGAADSAIFFGQDTGTTDGTFRDVLVADNVINGFATNRGILGRYGLVNSNWAVERNKIRGGGFARTTLASSVAAGGGSFAVAGGTGSSTVGAVTVGWGYLALGTASEELVKWTRSTDTFTIANGGSLQYAHASGAEFWALTGVVVGNTLGIDIQCAADNAGGPMQGLRLASNRIENVDQAGISVAAPSTLSEWSIDGNHTFKCRGIILANAVTGNRWDRGAIRGNTHDGYGVYSIYIFSVGVTGGGAAHGTVLVQGNVINGDNVNGNSIDGLRVESTGAGTVKVHAVGNVITGQFTTGIHEVQTAGTILGCYLDNDLQGNTGVAMNVGAAAVVRNNRGWATENKGTASILSGTTAIAVTHGLAVTPSAQDVSVTPTALSTTDPGEIYVDTFTSTQFTIRCRTNPGASNLALAWRATVL